jgi:RHS repeat-associated protein
LGDVPVAVYDGARNLVQQFVYLPGGVSVTLDATATSKTWSFPNLHGHVTATSNDNGDRLTSTVYDPWGVALNSAPNNVTGTADLAGYGGNGKLTESTTTKPVTHMGARPYTASTARFLTVDPIHGGCANHYVYGFGDPLNAQDLTGKAENPIVSCWGFMVHQNHVTYFGGVHNGTFNVAAVSDDPSAGFIGAYIDLDYSPAPFGLPRHLNKISHFAGLTMMANVVGAAVFSRSNMDGPDLMSGGGGGGGGIGLVGPFGVRQGAGGATSIAFSISLISESPNSIAAYYNHQGNFTCNI